MAQSQRKIRIGINGFGRIGRVVARLAQGDPDFELVAINDVVEDVENLAYLYNFDSTFGRAQMQAVAHPEKNGLLFGAERFAAVSKSHDLSKAEWPDVDVIVDSSGVFSNVLAARTLVESGATRRVVVTHVPKSGIDRHIIFGINEASFDPATDRVISSSICDANAIAHPLAVLDRAFGINAGFVTTLHPWLSYQNLVDSAVASQSDPKHFWKDYSLGRASTSSLIPKNTTAVTALKPVLPKIGEKLDAFSYRVPTAIVCSADIVVSVDATVTDDDVRACFREAFAKSSLVVLNEQSLTSIDYIQTPASASIDLQWVKVSGGRIVKVIVWYDNEWGYSSRVLDVVRLTARGR